MKPINGVYAGQNLNLRFVQPQSHLPQHQIQNQQQKVQISFNGNNHIHYGLQNNNHLVTPLPGINTYTNNILSPLTENKSLIMQRKSHF